MQTFIILMLLFSVVHAQEATPSNQHFWHTSTTSAAPEKVWELWTDVPQWKSWDTGLSDANMEGQFQLNSTREIISLEGRTSKFKVVEFTDGESYTFRTKLPLGSLCVKRYLSTEGGKTTFTHEVWFTGLTKGIFAKAFGEKFRAMLPEVLENIKHLAEKS